MTLVLEANTLASAAAVGSRELRLSASTFIDAECHTWVRVTPPEEVEETDE